MGVDSYASVGMYTPSLPRSAVPRLSLPLPSWRVPPDPNYATRATHTLDNQYVGQTVGDGLSQVLGENSFQPPAHLSTGVPAPADYVSGYLTSALQQLSLAIDPTPSSTSKGLVLRPEYYIQHVDKGVPVKNIDHAKLSYKDLVAGMGRVMQYLVNVRGDYMSYLRHFNYILTQASRHQFQDQAFVGYDRYIVDQVVRGEAREFVAGDNLAVASYFHAGNLSHQKVTQFKGKGKPYGGYKSRRGDGEKAVMPDGFPEDICYNFNYKSCTGKCGKSHVCRSCKKAHKATECPDKKQ